VGRGSSSQRGSRTRRRITEWWGAEEIAYLSPPSAGIHQPTPLFLNIFGVAAYPHTLLNPLSPSHTHRHLALEHNTNTQHTAPNSIAPFTPGNMKHNTQHCGPTTICHLQHKPYNTQYLHTTTHNHTLSHMNTHKTGMRHSASSSNNTSIRTHHRHSQGPG